MFSEHKYEREIRPIVYADPAGILGGPEAPSCFHIQALRDSQGCLGDSRSLVLPRTKGPVLSLSLQTWDPGSSFS